MCIQLQMSRKFKAFASGYALFLHIADLLVFGGQFILATKYLYATVWRAALFGPFSSVVRTHFVARNSISLHRGNILCLGCLWMNFSLAEPESESGLDWAGLLSIALGWAVHHRPRLPSRRPGPRPNLSSQCSFLLARFIEACQFSLKCFGVFCCALGVFFYIYL